MPSANHRLGRNGAVCLAAALLLLTGQRCGLPAQTLLVLLRGHAM